MVNQKNLRARLAFSLAGRRPGRFVLSGGVTAVALMLLTAAASAPIVVSQRGRAFSPDTLTVQAGQVVQFTNEDAYPHQIYVASDTTKFESGLQLPGSTVNVTFAHDGTFEVRCAIHPRMVLHVDVQ